jgi:hypothetical protein
MKILAPKIMALEIGPKRLYGDFIKNGSNEFD